MTMMAWRAEHDGRERQGVASGAAERGSEDWRLIDQALRAIAGRRCELDAEEARWLRAAEAAQIWRPLGMVSALDYLDRVLGYAPRKARERLRVARALGDLPGLTVALASGELVYSAVRELTRVATPATEAEWRAAAQGQTVRQIEDLVADRKPGDRPDDPPDPEARRRVIRFEVSAATFALLRQTQGVLDREHGYRLEDDDLVAALCDAVLDGGGAGETGRARHQVAVTVCERCGQGWQDGGGAPIAIDAAAVEAARCDAQVIGSLDAGVATRASQAIAPSIVRLVWRRDHGRCRVPGCRSARGLAIHHLIHRADGGGHAPQNLVLLCGACHRAHHAGRLTISGTADRLEVARAGEPSGRLAHVGPAGTQEAGEGADGGLAHVGRAATREAGEGADGGLAHVGQAGARHAGECAGGGLAHVGQRHAPREPRAPAPATGRLGRAITCAHAKQALVQLGWTSTIARNAVDAAAAALGPDAELEPLVREALRRCPRTGP